MANVDEHRPSPDELLARVQRAEREEERGKLRIFFGACAGVGKTYAMLLAAREQKAAGIDVVIGLVETPWAPDARSGALAVDPDVYSLR